MPVKIRLMRIGAKKRPFYRVVAVDERKKRTGAYIESLGTYNPLTEPKEIILKKDRVDFWLSQGAVASDGYLRIMKQAPQRPPRKPKKEKNVKEAPVEQMKSDASEDQNIGESEEVTPETQVEEKVEEQTEQAAEEKTEEAPEEKPAEEEKSEESTEE